MDRQEWLERHEMNQDCLIAGLDLIVTLYELKLEEIIDDMPDGNVKNELMTLQSECKKMLADEKRQWYEFECKLRPELAVEVEKMMNEPTPQHIKDLDN